MNKCRAEERLLNPPPGGRIEAARAHGIDLSLLVERLRKSPEGRVCDLQHAAAGLGGRTRQGAQNFARSGAALLIDFEQALTALAETCVRYVIVGGLAVTLHGSSSVTFNLGFCYACDRENLSRLAQALGPFRPRLRGAPPGLPFRFDEETLRGGLNFTLTTDQPDERGGRCRRLRGGVGRVRTGGLFGATIDVLTLDALIASKRAAGRPKDLLVLPELEALCEATED